MTDTPNVWFVGQRSRAEQYGGGWYCDGMADHGAKTLPDLAARIYAEHFRPGERILDATAGTGVNLVEAARAGLDGEGIELEAHFHNLAVQNTHIARERTGRDVWVYPGDARYLPRFVSGEFDGAVIDPPYGEIRMDGGRHQWGKRGALSNYSGESRLKRRRNTQNIGNIRYEAYLDAMQMVYSGVLLVTRPGARLVVILKNYRKQLEEIDLRGDTIRVAKAAGWRFHQGIVAVTSPVIWNAEAGPVIRPVVSGPQRRNCRVQTMREGIVQCLPVTQDVLVFKKGQARHTTVADSRSYGR